MDLDAFFAAVEVLENSQLAGKPVIVGGRPDQRGVVASASYAARAFGIRSAMPTARALSLCPQSIVLPPRHDVYRRYSRQVMAILRETTPLVEQLSVDEACLDLTEQVGTWQEAVAIARQLRKRVRDEVGLSASLGIAANKLVAKVAADRDKPGGLTAVPPGEEAAFLAPLPVQVLWGIGPVTTRRLAQMGVTTVGQLAQLPGHELRARFGSHGTSMARQAKGIDDRPVVTKHQRKSVSRERTFSQDLTDDEMLERQLWRISKGVAKRLQRSQLVAGTVALKLRYADFTTLTRQMTLDVPTQDEEVLYRAALSLLRRTREPGRPVRLMGIAGRHLSPPVGQQPLW
jgi:DNA polymerase-4